MSKTYTETEVKEIYAYAIEQLGFDAGAICQWSGVDKISLDDWKEAYWKTINEYARYEFQCGARKERERIVEYLLNKNK